MGAILMEVTEVMSWSELETQSFLKPDQVFFLPKDEGPVINVELHIFFCFWKWRME